MDMTKMLVFTNGTLIDGTGGKPVQKAIVMIRGNRFEQVGSEISYPEDSNVINLHSLTVIPGLIDCHLHLGGIIKDKPLQTIGKVSFMDMVFIFGDYFRNYARQRQLAIENGVTSIRSAGDNYPYIITLREKIESGKLIGPRVFASGPLFTAPGGVPVSTIWKGNRYIAEHAARQVEDAGQAREEVRKLADGSVDCIKAIYGDVDVMNLSHRVPKLTLNVLEAIADEAHKHRLRVMVHTGNLEEMMDAVKIGADSIEHGILPGFSSTEFPDNLINIMVERGVYFVPTLTPAKVYREMVPELLLTLKLIVKQIYDAGINIAVGTDSSSPGVVIGKAVHKEMELLVEAGMSPLAAIESGTKKAAENLGKGGELGTIEEGKLADMIVISGNPLEKIEKTRDIKMVLKDGVIVVNKLT